jgi:arylsulfatase A-like enzyme
VIRPGRRLLLFAIVCLAAACLPQPLRAPLGDHHLILINIDSLRADHLGCYGYARDTSPFIDSLCREAVVFERASAASSRTRESVAALMSARLPSKSGALGRHAEPGPPHLTLAERLHAHGYRTGLLDDGDALTRPGFARGFETVQHLATDANASGSGPRLSDAAVDFARATAPERFFLYLHYRDPRAPYAPAPEFHRRLAQDPPPPQPLALHADVLPRLAALRAEGFGPGDPRFEDLVTRYDAEIAATDAAVARLFRGLAELGVLEDALVVLTADHGEEFLEHDSLGHGWTLYEEVLHVPLLFWAPGALEPARVRPRASHVDLVPTLLTLLGVSDDGSKVDGLPLFEPGPGGLRPLTRERVQIAELLRHRQVVRSVLLDHWKYLAAPHWLEPAQRPGADEGGREDAPDLWGPPQREEVFDLASDPGEHHNALAEHARVRDELAGVLERFRGTGPNYGFPLDTRAAR